jgi:kumamolisin
MSAPRLVVVALLLVLVGSMFVGPVTLSAPLAGARTSGAATAATAAMGDTTLPSALAAPWASRAGYVADWSASTTAVHPLGGTVTVALTLWPRDLSLFSRPATAAPLTEAEFEATYSPTVASYTALEQYFEARGLTILHAYPDRLALTLQGPATAVGAAFATTLDAGVSGADSVQFPTSVPTLPSSLSPYVSAVSGLSSGFARFTYSFGALPLPAAGHVARPLQGGTADLISPAVIRQIYDVSSLYNYSGSLHYAKGVGIAVVLWGDGFDPSDVNTFYSQYYPSQFPPVSVVGVPVDGAPQPGPNAPSDPSNAPLELTLDLEYSGSEAPGATLYAVYAPDGPANDQYSPSDASLEDALNQAIGESGVDVVSMSFATADGSDPSFQAAFTTSFQHAAAIGITVVAASGDNGGTNNAKGACTTTPQPEFPAASPLVLAVGGTNPSLSMGITGQVNGLAGEAVWPDSGGGYATDYAAPTWQLVGSAAGPVGAHGQRGIPDLAAPSTYNFLYYNGAPGAGNGTSFGAPTLAGIVAEMDAIRGTPFGQIAPRLYSLGAAIPSGTVAPALVPITSGGNCLGAAQPGWDTATGWGSPRAGLLYNDLTNSYVLLNLTSGSADVAPGSSVEAIVSIHNATSHAPVVGVPVNLTLSAPGYTGPCGGTLSLGSAVTDANGNATVALALPSCFLGTHATISASVQARGLFGMAETTISVNLFGLASFLEVLQTYPYNVFAFAIIISIATVVGWSLGSWRHRRRIRQQAGLPPRGSAYAAASTAPAGASMTPPVARASLPPPPPAPPVLPAPGPGDPGASEAPFDAGPPGPPPVSPTAGTGAIVKCASCGLRFSPDLGFCPRCGQYVRPASDGPPAPPEGPSPPG